MSFLCFDDFFKVVIVVSFLVYGTGSYPPEDERPAWSAAMRNEVGYGVMVVTETEMKWTFYRSQLEGPDEVLDSVVITREQ